MALPKEMRLKGHRSFKYIYKNSYKYDGKYMTFKVARSNPEILLSHKFKKPFSNLKLAITISKKVSKKAVYRNKIRRLLQEWVLTNISRINNHKPCWLLVTLKVGSFYNDENILLEEFQKLMFKSRLIK